MGTTEASGDIREQFRRLPMAGGSTGDELRPELLDELERHARALRESGFELTVRTDSIKVRHRDRGYERVLQFSSDDDLGELRELHRSLIRAFGGFRERSLGWLFLPGPRITEPYESLRRIVRILQDARRTRPKPA